ncbi:hypothetical protein WOLCODRAFT_155612 [Wolfiporia cocos MD-104 SS10]|uniref:DUF6533 domain-containing protein n=1 Tax=Wolfiporia cocos (strain MD-104) TaxID=742152 RepID=A0A2H3JBC6_WOLCO|nr:hypothetical protein WOLCODRAFT_155612 [Wolfiporia cocos MD-104 SS10]
MSQGDAISSAALSALIASKLNEMWLANFCSVAATTLLVYDYSLTFSREIRCIWGRKFSGATVLYLLNRYLTLIYRILMIIEMIPSATMPGAQEIIIALFTSLRLYAIWFKDLKILFAVMLLGLVPAAVNIYYYTTVTFIPSPPPFMGCADIVNLSPSAGNIHRLAIFNCVFAIASDGIVLVLTWIKTAEIARAFTRAEKPTGHLVTLILRDGTLYFVTMLILNVINLVVIEFQDFGSLPALTEVLTSILISRFLLNLRGVYLAQGESRSYDESSLQSTRMSSLQFADDIVGNLGAPLSEDDHDEQYDEATGEDEENSYISDNPLIFGLHPERDGTNPTVWKLKDLYDSEV